MEPTGLEVMTAPQPIDWISQSLALIAIALIVGMFINAVFKRTAPSFMTIIIFAVAALFIAHYFLSPPYEIMQIIMVIGGASGGIAAWDAYWRPKQGK